MPSGLLGSVSAALSDPSRAVCVVSQVGRVVSAQSVGALLVSAPRPPGIELGLLACRLRSASNEP